PRLTRREARRVPTPSPARPRTPSSLDGLSMHADLPDLDLGFLANIGARLDLDVDVLCLLGIELHRVDRFGDLERLGQAVAGMGAVRFRGLLQSEKRDRTGLDAN